MIQNRRSFVVFSDDWGRHPSSSQHLFRRIAQDHLVLWVDTLGLRAPKADRFTLFRGVEKLRKWARPLRKASENLWVFRPVMLPVAGEGLLARLNAQMTSAAIRRAMRKIGMFQPVLWTSLPNAIDFVGKLDESIVVYYITDDFSLWPGGNAQVIRQADRQLREVADIIFPVNQSLVGNSDGETDKTVLLPHAVDFDHFVRPVPEPADLTGIPHPRACFFGLIYEKIDLKLLRMLVDRIRELQLVMIGPVKTDVSILRGLPNVHFLGPKLYESLPAYLQAVDVLVVPYVPDEESLAKGPLKIRECLAIGRPTVARSIPSLLEFSDVVHLYEDSQGFLAAVRTAMDEGDPLLRERMRQRVLGHSWEASVSTIMEHLARLEASSDTIPDLACRVTVTGDSPDWEGFLKTHSGAGIFHDPRWGQVMFRAYRNPAYYLTARHAGEVVATLQLVLQESRLFGSHLCSLPYFDAAGLLAIDEAASRAVMDKARRLMLEVKAQWVELRMTNPVDSSLPTREDKVTLRLPLPANEELLWKNLKAKVRNQVRKAENAGLQAVHGGAELLDEFFAVYLRTMRDLGSPPHSRRFFSLIFEAFGEVARLHVVRSGRTPVAASLTLRDRQAVCVPWAGSDWRVSELCGNMLLYWAMLSDACRSGATVFDFGRSTRESGTYRFKQQWGAQEVPLSWQFLLAGAVSLPKLRPENPKYSMLVRLWKRLPLGAVRLLGPHVIGKLS